MTLKEIKRKIRYLFLEVARLRGKKPTWIIVHHEAGSNGFKAVNEYHRQKWSFESSLGYFAGYQYYIGYDGIVHQARHDLEEGAHTIGFNKNSIGICLQGNLEKEQPKKAQLEALTNLLNKKKKEYKILNKKIEGHRAFSNTACPGEHLYNWLCKKYPS